MGSDIGRGIIATFNLFVGGYIVTVLANEIWQRHTPIRDTASLVLLGCCMIVSLLAILAGVLLLRRRTTRTGLRLHFSLANFILIMTIGLTFLMAWGRPDHILRHWDLVLTYWCAAVSGLWFGTGLTLQALMNHELAKRNLDAQTLWQAATNKTICSAVAA